MHSKHVKWVLNIVSIGICIKDKGINYHTIHNHPTSHGCYNARTQELKCMQQTSIRFILQHSYIENQTNTNTREGCAVYCRDFE